MIALHNEIGFELLLDESREIRINDNKFNNGIIIGELVTLIKMVI